ncbi:peptidyl-prolyl cis-trans isomerase [Psychromarinibacter sp. S121]|uniref:peptidylprolyl isomerase n=1 Tax=Psychromarinibacter sp. S121 TaxID=3415127 RepID=UPI003C7BE42B
MSLSTILRSPLVHFFVLGGCIFALFAMVDDTPPPPEPDALTLSADEARRIAQRFEQTWSRPPTADELDALMQSWALEEAFVREATALGLERGDPVIRQRLNLKMKFLAEGGAAALDADDATLQAYLDAHPDKFRRPAEVAFDQLQLSAQEASDPEAILAALRAGTDPATLAAPSLLPMRIGMMAAPVIGRSFGAGFAASLSELPQGEWAGPVQSGYGMHLVRVTERVPGAMPALDEVRARVETAWRAEKAKEASAAFGEMLLSRYNVSLPPVDEVLAE